MPAAARAAGAVPVSSESLVPVRREVRRGTLLFGLGHATSSGRAAACSGCGHASHAPARARPPAARVLRGHPSRGPPPLLRESFRTRPGPLPGRVPRAFEAWSQAPVNLRALPTPSYPYIRIHITFISAFLLKHAVRNRSVALNPPAPSPRRRLPRRGRDRNRLVSRRPGPKSPGFAQTGAEIAWFRADRGRNRLVSRRPGPNDRGAGGRIHAENLRRESR